MRYGLIITSVSLAASFSLAGCDLMQELRPQAKVYEDSPQAAPPPVPLRPEARPGPAPETSAAPGAPVTTPEQAPEPAPVPGVGSATGVLGTTIASLGDPSEPGLWLKTPLVRTETKGQLRYNGKAAQVRLIPLDGPPSGGSRLSLQAMQAIGAPLTDLAELTVSAI